MSKQQREQVRDGLAILEYSLILDIEKYAKHKKPELEAYDSYELRGDRFDEFYSLDELKEEEISSNLYVYEADKESLVGARSFSDFEQMSGNKIVAVDEDRNLLIGFVGVEQEAIATLQGDYILGVYKSDEGRFYFVRDKSSFLFGKAG